MEFGLDTFGDVTAGPDGKRLPYAQVIRNVVEQAVLADRLGVDAFGLGEHHRDDFALSAPDIALAAIAARTHRIKLGTSVTVLSSDDPVRVYERFATLDAVARAKSELPAALPADGTALLNADDPRVAAMADVTAARVVTFGRQPGADIRATDVTVDGA